MKKIWLSIKLFFGYFFYGMKAADNVISGGADGENEGINVENKIKNERHKVVQDLLRGEITEEVKELRHEMYQAERESLKYRYAGGGRGTKSIFGFNGDIENSDDLQIVIVQENYEIPPNVLDELSQNGNERTTHTINVTRDFLPSHKLEDFARLVTVRRRDEDSFVVDFYFYDAPRQFDRASRIFINELMRILDGDRRSDTLDFEAFSFTTRKCYGDDDNINYVYEKKSFEKAFTFNGNIILRFICTGGRCVDLLDDIYDEKAAKKIADKAPRKENGSTINLSSVYKEKYDTDTAEQLINEMNDGETQN